MAGPPADEPGSCLHARVILPSACKRNLGEGSLHGVEVTPLLYVVLHLSCAEGCVPPNGKRKNKYVKDTDSSD